jgi:hypothetical protein
MLCNNVGLSAPVSNKVGGTPLFSIKAENPHPALNYFFFTSLS